ncbi:DUF397 domain-containing protein [Streptomyces sp. TRM 70361]|uniref:DUF397 domain-containing protein n=1 Tax=Streptomyces sp. TRM 70361 TaxID=3116553 RepID=UPI002E7AF627|nr:DUF397 domain-containing protein [Streptomyces sp. TRM 70361]MEE1942156.1 DUF397 domain-containing protein [Streptomyces sp. TRM 70361]
MNTDLTWIKSSHSDNAGGNCVEIAAADDGIRVRDSKNLQGPQLTFTHREWADFLTLTAGG